MPLDPHSFNNTLLRSNSLLGFRELAIYHAQLLQIEAKPVYLFEQESLQGCPYRWIELPSELVHQFFDVMRTNKPCRRVHGESTWRTNPRRQFTRVTRPVNMRAPTDPPLLHPATREISDRSRMIDPRPAHEAACAFCFACTP